MAGNNQLWQISSITFSALQVVYVLLALLIEYLNVRSHRKQSRAPVGRAKAITESLRASLTVYNLPALNTINSSSSSDFLLPSDTDSSLSDQRSDKFESGSSFSTHNSEGQVSETYSSPSLDWNTQDIIDAGSHGTSSFSLSEPSKGCCRRSLVLPIYSRFLFLQLFQCVLWFGICVYLPWKKDDNLITWGSSVESRSSSLYVYASAALMGLHATVYDGVEMFLAQSSVGRDSIKRAVRIAIGWGALNWIGLTVTAVLGQKANRDAGDFYEGNSFAHCALWSPFFLRVITMFAFNFYLLFAPTSLMIIDRSPLRSSSDVKNGGARTCWGKLTIYNFSISAILLAMYLCDFNIPHFGDKAAGWIYLTTFLFFFVHTTPALFIALLYDSSYWTAMWTNRLTSLPSYIHNKNPSKSPSDLSVRLLDSEHVPTGNNTENTSSDGKSKDYEPENGSDWSDENGDRNGLVVDFQDLTIGAEVGSGGFSTVYTGRLWNISCAIKMLHVPKMTKEIVENFLDEVSLLSELRHPNVVSLIGAAISPPDFAIITERCSTKSLASQLKDPKISFSPARALQIALGIANAMTFMHANHVLHRDLKASNILFDPVGNPKVCDFGLAHRTSENEAMQGKVLGTLGYMAPEVLRKQPISDKSDVYAFGLILWELMHNKGAWNKLKNKGPLIFIKLVTLKHQRPIIGDHVHPVIEKLIRCCWDRDPSIRPSFQQVQYCLREFLDSKQCTSPMSAAPSSSGSLSPLCSQQKQLPSSNLVASETDSSTSSLVPSSTSLSSISIKASQE